MMMFETSKHVPKTEKRCCVFENNSWGLVLIGCKKQQMPHHAEHEIAENAPTPGVTEDVPDESVVE